jgi:hypothetical protein
MFWKKRTEEIVVAEFDREELEEVKSEEEAVSQRNCAWCGDPPDQYGSHGICAFHADQMLQQVQSRRRGR